MDVNIGSNANSNRNFIDESNRADLSIVSSIKGEDFSFLGHSKFQKIDMEWKNISITTMQSQKKLVDGKRTTITQKKIILNNVSGSAKNGNFTAIMGPSGSGKTTLLNFLSARISGNNLEIQGDLKINSKSIPDLEVIGNLVAYVMQDDILMATSSPREAFMFAANLRLNNTSKEKHEKVDGLLKDLGLSHCANTKIGNTMIRGISGGERKRTSIGVELITNPSMIFLDEPTTGLDSQTSLNLILLLRNLSLQGRTIVCTIHQPNSELYSNFDNLMLLVRGNVIYQGKANLAVDHFGSFGYLCPKYSNPADYFMKIMNETGLIVDALKQNPKGGSEINVEDINEAIIEKQFAQRIAIFVEKYTKSDQPNLCHKHILKNPIKNKNLYNVSWLTQMLLVLHRTAQFEIRNPMDMQLKALQYLIYSLILIAVFYNLGTGDSGIQTTNGLLFTISTIFCFGSITGSIMTFSIERPVFIRERLSKSYSASSYFVGKCLAELPFFCIYPVILLSIVYFTIGLNASDNGRFGIALATGILAFFSASGYGLCISTLITKLEFALSLTPVIIVPLLAFAGFFVNQNNIPYFFYEFFYISPFRYTYQTYVQNQYDGLVMNNCGKLQNKQCDPLGEAGFKENIGLSLAILAILGIGFRIIAYIGLVFISSPKKPKIERKSIDET